MTSIRTTSTGNGTLLRKLLAGDTLAKKTAPTPPIRRTGGLYAEMFATSKASRPALVKATPPAVRHGNTQSSAPTPTAFGERKPVQQSDDPRADHAEQLRQTANAHAELVESVKRALNPGASGSTGPAPL
ncbi:MAG: hypothetical protein KGM91_23210 [Burkholderiales bacterium]|nr:hypothetical protein [Burkholderiales bacterium]